MDLIDRLKKIAELEGITLEEEALDKAREYLRRAESDDDAGTIIELEYEHNILIGIHLDGDYTDSAGHLIPDRVKIYEQADPDFVFDPIGL